MSKKIDLEILAAICLVLTLFTSCATKRDWKESHYQNANKAAEAKTLCDSGQKQEAAKLGYTCYPRDQNGRIITNTATANGNVNNIYLNQNKGYSRTPQQQMIGVMNSIYQQERNDRLNRICTFNGSC